MAAARREPIKVPKHLHKQARELHELARRLKNMTKGDVWFGRPELLESVEKRITGALKAIRYTRTNADVERNIIAMIETGAVSTTRTDQPRTLERAVKRCVENIEGVLSGTGNNAEVSEDLVRRAIEAFVRPALGRPPKGAISRDAAFGALLTSIGLVSEELSEPALRRHIARLRK